MFYVGQKPKLINGRYATVEQRTEQVNSAILTNRHQCSICDKKFNHTSNLRKHLIMHSGLKPFHCNVCQKKFSQKS